MLSFSESHFMQCFCHSHPVPRFGLPFSTAPCPELALQLPHIYQEQEKQYYCCNSTKVSYNCLPLSGAFLIEILWHVLTSHSALIRDRTKKVLNKKRRARARQWNYGLLNMHDPTFRQLNRSIRR